MKKFSATGLCWLWVTVVVVLLDRITKFFAQKYLVMRDAVPMMPHFNFMLDYNKGAAFSFLNSASGWQTWIFAAIAIIVSAMLCVWLYRLACRERWLSIALTLIIGGALGNLCDRFLYGHVIDFIQWYAGNWYWPTFNIADSAICVGAAMLFIEAVFLKKK